ncbi:2-polyprenylphenol 6-hydroxylase [Ancylobacter amanitiformis]|uniref:Ubiquinone biosynthesis protein n=1 Tax=Ancylobacter amanitiformis TaxID=217069 RepID=A0ABU0LUQ5_9HYPH|nr:2-polyprenylphenol 6-hydroxylase [Ancylobacter amanitiformis]MDQ0512410.1 ubiquinone biosynthesis protein [Ancylobacter amanitiformis]
MATPLGDFLRLARAGYVLAREGVFTRIDPALMPPGSEPLFAAARLIARPGTTGDPARIGVALSRLGPSYVKLGQFLATRPDVVGPQLARDLQLLQDRMPPFPQEVAEAIIARNFDRPALAVYARLGPALAAASIAQVHQGEIAEADGTVRRVAVKVLRPDVQRRFRIDLSSFYRVARLGERASPEGRRLRLIAVVDTLARSMSMEMDLRLEAAALAELAQNTQGEEDFRVPTVDWDRTGREVLTTEWIDGIKLNDLDALRAAGHDLPDMGRIVMQSFLRHALRDGFFHADMHPGNLFVDPQGRLVAVDCGIMGRLGQKERRFLAEILYGFITRNWLRVAQVHFEAGYVPAHHSVEDFAQAIRAIGEPIHSRPADQISMAKLLTLLFEVTALFDMKTRPELLLLQKTMVVVEGVARALDPHLDMWKTAEPVVRTWIERNLGPAARLEEVADGVGALGRSLQALPELIAQGQRIAAQIDSATRNGLALAPETMEAIGRAEGRGNRWMTLALWVIAALLAGHLLF